LIRRSAQSDIRSLLMRGAFRAKRQYSMSAAQASATSHTLPDEARANEPSMEEILASIRRIIADDESMPGVRRDVRRRARVDSEATSTARGAYPAPALERGQDEPPLPIADGARSERGDAAALRPLVGADDAGQEREAASSNAETPSKAERVTEMEYLDPDIVGLASGQDAPLLSAEAAATVASQFQTLAAGVAFSDSDILNRCAQDLLRPMVEKWLNDNLPSLVERLVRGEIERITRAGSRATASAAKSIQP